MPDPEDVLDDEPLLDDELLDENLDELDDPGDGPQDDPDDGSDGDEGDDASQSRQPTRGQTRFQRLTAERDQERRERERIERELQAERQARGRGPERSADELRRERETLLSSMTAEQRLEYLQREGEQRLTQRINQMEFNTFDATDRAAFDTLCERSPAATRLKADVERELAAMRANGQNAPRRTVLAYLIGDKALSAQPKARARSQRAAAEGRDRQGARPVNGRGDTPQSGNRRLNEQEARRARLENVKL